MISVTNDFHKKAFGQIINPIVKLYISFPKVVDEGVFFTLDQSHLNGPDILRATSVDTPAQDWDFYDYNDYTDRLVQVEWSRSVEFPYQVQSAMADFTIDNTDGFFTPLNVTSSIGASNLPARPVRLMAGYDGTANIVPQFVGMTEELPDVKEKSKTVTYHAIDFLYDICQQPLSKVVDMRDVTTDQVIAAILEAYGLSPLQYQLTKGKYKVPFVFFDAGEDAGSALKQLVQSENGFLWLDEKGIVHFDTSARVASETEIAATLTDYDILELSNSKNANLINHVRVSAELREVQEWQEVYTKSDSTQTVGDSLWVVPANSTLEMRCGLSDPCYDVVAPTLGKASSVSWFTAIDEQMRPVTVGISAAGVLSSNAYTITFTNNNSYPVEINEMKLWGEPAKVYDEILYDAYDDESVAKYGEHLLEVSDNKFFQTYEQAANFAQTIIGERRAYNRTITASIKGDFAFQLMDLIKLTTSRSAYNGIYRILGIEYKLSAGSLVATLTLNGSSIQAGAFTLNVSKLNGEDILQ